MRIAVNTDNKQLHEIVSSYIRSNYQKAIFHTIELADNYTIIINNPEDKLMSDITRCTKAMCKMVKISCTVYPDVKSDDNNTYIEEE